MLKSRKRNKTMISTVDDAFDSWEARQPKPVDDQDEIDKMLNGISVMYESVPPHRRFVQWITRSDSYGGSYEELQFSNRGAADLVSSQTMDGKHAPVID